MTRARVHLIEDDATARDSLKFLLETDRFMVSTYESAIAFLDASPSTTGCCVVTDVRMPGMDGIELLRNLRARSIDCPVIVVTGHADMPLAIEAITNGAFDFIEKPFDADVLLGAVRAALDPATELGQNGLRDRLATLSDRERHVFDRIVLGHSNRVVAEQLDISERNVEIYRANVMTKMQARTLSNLVRVAMTLR